MYRDFNDLPKSSRIWIYQAQRNLNQSEISQIELFLQNAITSWESHGSPVKGSFKLFYDRILVIAAQDGFSEVSGCSIDSSTRWLKQIFNETGIDFFDRSIPYFEEESLKYFPVFQAKKYISENIIEAGTLVLNHQISSLNDLIDHWKIKASLSPLSRYFLQNVKA